MSAPYRLISLKSENMTRPFTPNQEASSYNCVVLNRDGQSVIREFTYSELMTMLGEDELARQFEAASIRKPEYIQS